MKNSTSTDLRTMMMKSGMACIFWKLEICFDMTMQSMCQVKGKSLVTKNKFDMINEQLNKEMMELFKDGWWWWRMFSTWWNVSAAWIIHTYTHTYIHTDIHACILTYIHRYMHAYLHTYIHTYIHTCMHAYILYTLACMHTYYTYLHAYYTYLQACIHTYILYIHIYL